jgi:hypothetical protein
LMQGPLQCWWFTVSERCVGKVASYVKKGGKSYDKTMWKKYMAFELSNRINFTSALFENKKVSPFLRIVENIDNGRKELRFSSLRYFLSDLSKETWRFYKQDFFLGTLFIALILEIESQSISVATAASTVSVNALVSEKHK